MESKFQITAEEILNAKDYIPREERAELIEAIAQDCIAKVVMSYIPTGEEDAVAMPHRYQENRTNTNLYLMGVLAVKYLGTEQPFGEEKAFKMPMDLYDKWAGGHVPNQPEAFKSSKDAAVKEKAFNLLQDFRDFRAELYREIETLLGHHNDVVWRLTDVFKGLLHEEAMAAMGQELNAVQEAEEQMTPEERAERIRAERAEIDAAIEKLEEMRKGLEAATSGEGK